MNATQLLTGPLAQAIGWALLHLLWQATIVAGILAAALALLPRKNASVRYVVACGALALVFAMFIATAVRAYDPAAEPIAPSRPGSAAMTIPLTQVPILVAKGAALGLRERIVAGLSSARASLPSIVGIWLAGVVLLSARLLVSWIRARRLVNGAASADREWQRVATRLSSALGLRRAVMLLESAAVEVPSVIGSLRPVVLLPASALTGLTPQQIEMVLAHELAHIRRHDFVVNLLQAVVETLMFYHPAVWWMSQRVRVERENCCDDLAVAVCGDPIQYARALTRLEELRASALPVVVAANGGSLLERIRRIAAGRAEGTTSSSRWAAAVTTLTILAVAVAIPSIPALAERAAKSKEAKPKIEKPAKTPGATVEVVESRAQELPVDVSVDVDVPVEMPDPPDVDIETPEVPEFHFDYDFDPVIAEAPEPPELPEFVMAGVAPVAAVAPAPGVPAAAPTPAVAATPRAPRPPRAPRAYIAGRMADADWEASDKEKDKDRELGSGGKLSVDELIALRAAGVTPEYVNTMRDLFPGLTLRQVTSLSAVGVTPEFVREMTAAGLEAKSARDMTSLRAVGVTPEFIAQMRAIGFEVKSARDATSLRAVDVSPEWLRSMRDAGVKIDNARDAVRLRAVGVTPEFVKRLAAAGYANLSARELARLAAAGVDEDFIRSMEQYRKK